MGLGFFWCDEDLPELDSSDCSTTLYIYKSDWIVHFKRMNFLVSELQPYKDVAKQTNKQGLSAPER